MSRSIRFLPVIALVLATLTAAFAFSPRAVAAGRTPEQIAEANRVKAQQLAEKAILSIDKALNGGSHRFDNLAEVAIRNMDKLFTKKVTDLRKYQAAIASAVTSVNKDSAKTLVGVAKTIASTQKAITKLNQPEILATFLTDAGTRVTEFAGPSAEAIARMNDRLLEITQLLANQTP
jgi:hypothetical protein